jgi:hypothetical protein
VRVRDHVVLSTAGAALLSPWIGRRVVAPWAASILIDGDHYVWFCLRHRRLDPLAAAHYFDEAQPLRHPATRVLHSPIVLLTMLLLGTRRRRALPLALGMVLHVALDIHHEARMNQARTAVLRRDHFTCQTCGTRGPQVGTHLARQPWLLPSYGTQNLVTLCGNCHEAAHARRTPIRLTTSSRFRPETESRQPEDQAGEEA